MDTERIKDLDSAMANATPNFIQVDDYTTFRAEFGLSHKGHFVMHFFATDEVKTLPDDQARKYWLTSFRDALEVAAAQHLRYFEPKLFYIDDMVSWCIEIDQPEIPGAVAEFFDLLDQTLETLKST